LIHPLALAGKRFKIILTGQMMKTALSFQFARPYAGQSCPKRSPFVKILVLACAVSGAIFSASNATAASPENALLGRWDLTLTTPAGLVPSWIEISDNHGHPAVLLVGACCHALPLKEVAMKDGGIEFLAPKGDHGYPDDILFKGKLVGHDLEGTATYPGGKPWSWKGTRAPELAGKATPEWGQPVKLFDGTNLDGWNYRNKARTGSWKVEDGLLLSTPRGSDLITNDKFEDFKLHIEFKCGPGANSGVYLRGRYEVQVETDSVAEPNSHHTGGVYGFLDPTPEQPRQIDKWQSFDITFVGRNLTLVHNGVTVIDHRDIPGITGGALDSHEGAPGPIMLQGGETGVTAFRNIVITPAK
jgi:hypothetical protein